MIARRSFLGLIACAPAIVRAESLMKIWVPPKRLFVDPFYRGVDLIKLGDGEFTIEWWSYPKTENQARIHPAARGGDFLHIHHG